MRRRRSPRWGRLRGGEGGPIGTEQRERAGRTVARSARRPTPADPGQFGTLSSDASTEVAVAQAEASASLAALTPELMATKPVHETIALPAVPAPEALPELAPVGEMERLEAWDLTATDGVAFDRDAFDAYHGNLGEDALNGIADEMKTAGTDLQAERVRLVDTGLSDAEAANAEAQAKQSAEVAGAQADLAAETDATRAAQQQVLTLTQNRGFLRGSAA